MHRRREDCRICGGRSLQRVLSLGETPLANAFLRKDQLSETEPRFPLDVYLCADCGHAQLLDVVSPEVLFRNYVYVSSTSPSFVEHFRKYAEEVSRSCSLAEGDQVVEIGSNDGVLLKHFQQRGMRVLGVDPAVEIARRATSEGVETLPEFFTPELAERLRVNRGAASLIAANNVFAHADDLHGMLEGVRRLLAPGGAFVFEVSYLLDVIEKTLFDTIYHEHLAYHSVKALDRLFELHGMELFDAVRIPTHGGSLRGFAQWRGGGRQRQPSVAKLLELEKAAGLDQAKTFIQFGQDIEHLKQELRDCLKKLKSAGKRIAGYGAPAKLTTLMHHFEIDASFVEFVVDDSPLKQGLFTPGHHIPVEPVTKLYESRPDYALILAWNFADAIIRNHKRFADEGGRFIIPLPRLEIR